MLPAGDGIVSATANFAGNFAAVPTSAATVPGSATYSLVLTGSNVASGLFALDAADTSVGDGDGIGQGAQIVLNQSGNIITGSVGAHHLLHDPDQPGDGRGDVHRQHGEQSVALEHGQP